MEDITVEDLNRPEVRNWLESLTQFKTSYFDYQNNDELDILFNAAINATSVEIQAFSPVNIHIYMNERVTEVYLDVTDGSDCDLNILLQNKKGLVRAEISTLHIYNYKDIEPFLNNNSSSLKHLYLDIYGLEHSDYIKLIDRIQLMNCHYELNMYYNEDEKDKVKELVRNYNASFEWSNGGYVGIIATVSGPQPKFLTLHVIK